MERITQRNFMVLGIVVAILAVTHTFFPNVVSASDVSLFGLIGTTLAVNTPRAYEIGSRNEFLVIASDIIYEGAAVGLVDGTGHARPLTAVDRFAGFAEATADNAAGAATAITVRVIESGKVQLAVTGALITDVGQPVYATDDATFGFNPVSAQFIGYVHRFVSAGVVVVRFDAPVIADPWAHKTMRETLSGTKTFDAQDNAKLFAIDADADNDALTLPSIADGFQGATFLAVGAFGTTKVVISPAAADMILGPDMAGVDNKDLLLTKATQRRGDFATLIAGDADGYSVIEQRGIWAAE